MEHSRSTNRPYLSILLVVAMVAAPLHGIAQVANPSESVETVQAVIDPNRAPSKTVILYSTIGMGHLSAARAIEADIKRKDPKAVVVMKNIRDFMGSKTRERLDEKLFWYVVKNYPNFFDAKFRESMARGNQAMRLEDLPSSYDERALEHFLVNQNPTSIIATHYGSAVSLGNLKSKGFLKNTPVAWLHTDYFTGFFPRISQRIEKTFLPMAQMKDTWIDAGVRETAVTTTGMPINPMLFDPLDRVEFLKSKGLDPNIRTIVLASGGEGVGNFPLIVEKLAKDLGGPLQIVAVCAKNEDHVANLTKLAPSLPSDVKVQIHGMVPNVELLNYIKSADLYVTKSGGLSPTEGFAIARPMILLDVYGGHERDNANLFEKEGLAVVNRDQSKIGEEAKALFANQPLLKSMNEKQLEFRNSFNLGEISEFAFNARETLSPRNFSLGVEGGQTVSGAREALHRLETESPADVEVILSYGKSADGAYLTKQGNPFGHLAVRVGDKVYTANGRADRQYEQSQIFVSSLENYLYGVDRPTANVEHTDAYGSSYGRDNLSVRVRGLAPDAIRAMEEEVSKIDAEWKDGKIQWDAKKYNCADFVARILRAGGYDPESAVKMGSLDPRVRKGHITMPVEVFDAFRVEFENRPGLETEIVSYTQVEGSQNHFRTTRFPLSIHRMKSSVMSVLKASMNDLELRVGKRLSVYSQEPVVKFENLNGQSASKRTTLATQREEALRKAFDQIVSIEGQLEQGHANAKASQNTVQAVQSEIEEFLGNLSVDDREKFVRGDITQMSRPDLRKEAETKMRRLEDWDHQAKALQDQLDQMTQAELDYLLHGLKYVADETMDRIKASENVQRIKALNPSYTEMMQAFDKYEKFRTNYGQPKDGPTRTVATRTFFERAKTYMDMLSQIETREPTPKMKEFWNNLGTKMPKFYKMLTTFIRLAPDVLRLVLDITFRQVTPPGESPVNQSIGRLFRQLGESLGMRVRVDRPVLPTAKKTSGRSVNIIVATHRDPILDTITMANLGVDNALLVMATDQIVPNKKLADQVNAVDSIITVGRGSDLPIQKIIEQLNRNKTDQIMIYPEGSVSAGLGETRPLREKFTTGLIRALVAQGFDVNITPLTYTTTGKMLSTGSLGELLASCAEERSRELAVKVGQPISAEMIKLLARASDDSLALNRLLRAVWLENLPTNQERLMGQPRANVIRDELANLTHSKNATTRKGMAGAGIRCEAVFAP